MRFWDASAVIPLVLEQPATARSLALLAEDPDVVIWWATPVECASALARVRREGLLTEVDEARAVARLDALRSGWYEMLPGDAVRAQALRVLRLHPLRAADALQLGAAMEWVGAPAVGALVTFDDRMAAAAAREGFEVLGR